MLDFRIATFLQLCETKSYTRTAKILNITQPSVTQHIKYLERRYQCKLFHYEGKILHLTPEGEYLCVQAKEIRKMSEKVAADLQRISSRNPLLRFGCPKELGEMLITRIIADMLTQEQLPEISLIMQPAGELIQMLENGYLDVILTDEIHAENNTLVSTPAVQTTYAGYAAKRLVENLQTDDIEKLLQTCLLVGESDASDRERLNLLLAQKHLTTEDFQHIRIVNSSVCLQELAAVGTGIYFTYASNILELVRQNRVQPITKHPVVCDLLFLYHKNSLNAIHYKAFFEMFQKLWTQHIQQT